MIKIIPPQNNQGYKMPTKVFFGRNALGLLHKIITGNNLQNILLVAGEHFKTSIDFRDLLKGLENTTVYPQPIKKTDFNSINQLTQFMEKNLFDGIIAIGGGTILDTAKSAAGVFGTGGEIEDYLIAQTKKISKKGIFFIAVPTTSGTGSEVTPWAAVWEKNKKYSLDSKYLFPDIAVIDPALTDALPAKVTAESGIDALCQAIEAYWNVNCNPLSDKYALQAISEILKNLDKAVNNPTSNSRDGCSWGSLLGGLAFSNTRTTICHSISYPISAHWNVSHGQATSITLPLFIEYIFPVITKDKLSKILKVMKTKRIDEASEKIKKLMKDIGLKTKLSQLGIPREGIELIVKKGYDPSRAKNSPRIPKPNELREMLYSIF